MVKDSLLKRQKTIESQMISLNAEIRIREKRLEQLSIMYNANQQVLKDFATEEAIKEESISLEDIQRAVKSGEPLEVPPEAATKII